MVTMTEVTNETEMQTLGESIGKSLSGGEVIELIGDVGAGKTTFVRGLARGLDIDETIQSPSFTISKVYDARDNLRLFHYDFYRIKDPGIMAGDLHEALNDDTSIVVVEWSDTIKSLLPDDRLSISIMTISETSRSIELKSGGGSSSKIIEAIK